MKSFHLTATAVSTAVLATAFSAGVAAATTTLYFQGFETDTTDWNAAASRVASGTGGIASASGGFHAESLGTGAFHFFGTGSGAASNASNPFSVALTASIDFFLDVGGGWANDRRFDYSVGLSNTANAHLRDFIFNVGFYDDATGPGAGTDRFVITASNNAGRGDSFPKNPQRNPISIATSGWYTFQHNFFNDGGTLGAVLSVLDSGGTSLGSWSFGTDPIGNVGGERYGWIVNNEFSRLAYDNVSLTAAPIPLPAAGWLLLGGLGALGAAARRKRRKAA